MGRRRPSLIRRIAERIGLWHSPNADRQAVREYALRVNRDARQEVHAARDRRNVLSLRQQVIERRGRSHG